ncbi:hypothetical protein [Saccharibacter sp. 17.LH.SD]|uniref:hypothetical protein n=1 Tax=Saccharibacter sp. 17.LH.SD TaxID=2689393 RepID=UPI001F1EC0D8|nr:hypothetical protein [Saccharibacter sp. 17.LH.SD]
MFFRTLSSVEYKDTPTPVTTSNPAIAGDINLPMLAPDKIPYAIARSYFSPQQQSLLLAAVKERRISLAVISVADANLQSGRILDITCGGITQHVVLSPICKTSFFLLTKQAFSNFAGPIIRQQIRSILQPLTP